MTIPVPSELAKEYPQRGPMKQYRFRDATSFQCFRCGQSKKSKLITIYQGDWNRRLCNGCYGRLLSIHDIKAGTSDDDEKAEALAELLTSLVSRHEREEAERLYRLSERRSESISPQSVRYLATADHVADSLGAGQDLEWSPAVIGLCKAVELEVFDRLVSPLLTMRGDGRLKDDVEDKDIGRIAKFIRDGSGKPPELGTFAHFLQTVTHSEKRRKSSPLIQEFLRQMKNWPDANWILDSNGLYESIETLTADYRNRAAHVEDLYRDDYESCRQLVVGSEGLLWKLVQATQTRC